MSHKQTEEYLESRRDFFEEKIEEAGDVFEELINNGYSREAAQFFSNGVGRLQARLGDNIPEGFDNEGNPKI